MPPEQGSSGDFRKSPRLKYESPSTADKASAVGRFPWETRDSEQTEPDGYDALLDRLNGNDPSMRRSDEAHEEGDAAHGRMPTVFSFHVRQGIRDAWVQAHAINVERMKSAKSQGDPATYGTLTAQVRSLAEARKVGTPNDRRAALLSLAASCVYLAERETREPEPKRGRKRSSTERWKPVDFRIPPDVNQAA